MMQVALRPPVKIELVDEEIITLAGCDLGFIMPGKPPQVLQIEQGSEMAAHGLRTDDVLVGVDGRDIRDVSKEELQRLLREAKNLTFERPGADGDVEMAPRGDIADRTEAALQVQAAPAKEAPAQEAPSTQAAAEPAAAEASAEVQKAPLEAAPAASSTGAAGDRELRTGMRVRLVGFQNATMNGSKGQLGKFSSKQGLWQVFLETTSASKAVKPVNLEALEDQSGPDISGASRSSGSAANGAAGALADLANSPMVAAMAAAMRGVVPAPTLPHFDGPGPPPGPEWQEDVVPVDEDKESWVELMRDAHVRQLRTDAEHPEPPPFQRANHFSGVSLPGQPLPEGKFPAQALNFQLQMLLRARTGDYPGHLMASSPYGQGSGAYWMPRGRWGGYGKGGGGFGMSRGQPRWVPVAPAGHPGAAGPMGEPPRIVFPPTGRG